MNGKRWTGIFCLLIMAGLTHAPMLMADSHMDRERDLTRVRKKIEALRAWQLTETLDLDEETSSRLFPAMKKTDRERWKVEARNRELVQEMSRVLERRGPDPRRINSILDELLANRRELVGIEERHIKRVRQILSPEDTARYVMFQIRFQREIKQKASEALRDKRRRDDRQGDKPDMFEGRDRDDGGSGGRSDSISGSDGGSADGDRRR